MRVKPWFFRDDVINILNQAVVSGKDGNTWLYGPDYFKAIEVIATGFGVKVDVPKNVSPMTIVHNE